MNDPSESKPTLTQAKIKMEDQNVQAPTNRSKRTPKQPKRFDDEAFDSRVTPRNSQPKQEPVKEVAKPSPEPTQTKSIIKVKLATPRIKPKDAFELKDVKDIKKEPKETPAKKKHKPNEQPTKLNESVKDPVVKTPKEPIKTHKELLKTPKEPVLKETPPKAPKEVKEKPVSEGRPAGRPPGRPPKDRSLSKDGPKPKELSKPREIPRFDPKLHDRDSQLVYRPKTRRPRTPPTYADLIPNVVLPFWDARTAAEEHEDDNVKELVHCHCGVPEELGLMVQCETCLTWQHAHCLGIEKPEDAPDGYTCRACSDPKFSRDSMRWAYDQEWLTKGRMKQFPCDQNPKPEKSMNTLRQINQLIGNVLNIHQIIHSLRVKTKILQEASDDDPELKMFKNQWPATYQHRDTTQFMPTINHPSSTPASTISAINDTETPDPGDINVETVADAALPDIGQLEDVSAILDNPFVANPPMHEQPMPMVTNTNDVTPNDCRANLRLHIQQTEEFISIELAQIEEQLSALEKECSSGKTLNEMDTSLDSLKNDLHTMRKYVTQRHHEN